MSHEFLFYLEHITADTDEVRLEGEEHHHLARVVRMIAGDRAFVTDGSGTMVECRVKAVEKLYTGLEVVRGVETCSHRRLPVLALGCIKKERFERAVAYATELGIERCIPVISSNSSRLNYNDKYLNRLRTIALSAMKQSFRAILPEIEAPLSIDDLLERMPDYDSVFTGMQDSPPLSAPPAGEGILIVVGPEAGFAPDEQRKFTEAGAIAASVSSHRLRSETAALTMLSIVNSPRPDRQSD